MDADMEEEFRRLLGKWVSLFMDEATMAMDAGELLDLLETVIDAAASLNVNTEITVHAGTESMSVGGLPGDDVEAIISAIVARPEEFADGGSFLAASVLAMGLYTCTDEFERIRKYNGRGSPVDASLLRLAAVGATFTMEPRTDQPARGSSACPRYIIRRTRV